MDIAEQCFSVAEIYTLTGLDQDARTLPSSTAGRGKRRIPRRGGRALSSVGSIRHVAGARRQGRHVITVSIKKRCHVGYFTTCNSPATSALWPLNRYVLSRGSLTSHSAGKKRQCAPHIFFSHSASYVYPVRTALLSAAWTHGSRRISHKHFRVDSESTFISPIQSLAKSR